MNILADLFLLPDMTAGHMILIMSIFFVAGIIKGFLGIGLPAAAMAMLTLTIDPRTAISLLILPIIFTNLIQFSRAPGAAQTASRYKYFALAIIVSIFITSLFINSYPTSLLTVGIGVAMVVFSANLLFGISVPVTAHLGWQIGVGFIAGILGGLSSIWSPPVAMYLLARNVSKDEFISATGFLFLSGSLFLAGGLAISGLLTLETILQSLLGLIVVLLGFRAGEKMRGFISQEGFKKLVLFAFLIMGMRLIITGFF